MNLYLRLLLVIFAISSGTHLTKYFLKAGLIQDLEYVQWEEFHEQSEPDCLSKDFPYYPNINFGLFHAFFLKDPVGKSFLHQDLFVKLISYYFLDIPPPA